MFLLIATYGLRVSEDVALTLEDIRWRSNQIRIFQRKTSATLELPLTNEVATALFKYLKQVPPRPPYRQYLFSDDSSHRPPQSDRCDLSISGVVPSQPARHPFSGCTLYSSFLCRKSAEKRYFS